MRFIYGTSANETLPATPAAPDEFVLTSLATGSDTISGFNPAQDMIEFSKAQFASFTDVQAATSAISGGATINLPNGSSLSLPGVDGGLAARQQLCADLTQHDQPRGACETNAISPERRRANLARKGSGVVERRRFNDR